MGFSIGRLIGSIAPGLGGILGGIPGAILGQGISAALTPPPKLVGRQTSPAAPAPVVAATSVTPFPQATFSPSGGRRGFAASPVIRGAAAGGVGAAIVDFGLGFFDGNGGSEISDVLATARSNVRGATKKKIIAAAKACGIDTAAATFGLDPRQVCLVIVSGAGRRRRGVSAADIRRTKRTLRFVSSLRKDLKKIKA